MMPEHLYQKLAQEGHKRALKLYRVQNSLWMLLAIASVITFAHWLSDPVGAATAGALGRELSSPLDDLWNISFGLGGVLIIHGIWSFKSRVEIIGHLLFGGGTMVYALAIAADTIQDDRPFAPAAFTVAAISLASAARIYFLWTTTPKKKDDL